MITATPRFLVEHYQVLVVSPLRILLIVVLALLARTLLQRTIRRLTRSSVETDVPFLLRPLRDRVGVSGLLENAGLVSERRRQRAETIGSILRSVTSVVIFAIAAMLILGELRLNLAPILASAGIVGFALGFGAQNLVKDFVSGVFMLLEDQYGVGDVIDIGPATGTVEDVGLRVTSLRDDYGTVWYVRNGEVARVGNKSQGYAQVVLDMPIPGDADPDRAGRAIEAAADDLWHDEEWSDAIMERPELLGIEQVSSDGVVLRLTVKTRPLEQWRVGRELRRRVKLRLDAEGAARSDSDVQVQIDAEAPSGRTEPNRQA